MSVQGVEILIIVFGVVLPTLYMAHLLWRHRKTQTVLIAPRWSQAVLFPTIVLVGTLLGRYRGTDWPGCPDRFPAAPLST